MQNLTLRTMLSRNENILWQGKPDKKCFILESIFNPLLPFALVWLAFDSTFIMLITQSSNSAQASAFLIPFFALHLMPVWLYLGGVLFSFRKYQNTEFMVTDKGIYVSGGILSYNYEMKPFTEISHVNIHRGIFDQILGVGDVVLSCGHSGYNSRSSHSFLGLTICDIPDYQRVFRLVKDLQEDVYSDTMYPNALRPQENPRYKTRLQKEYE